MFYKYDSFCSSVSMFRHNSHDLFVLHFKPSVDYLKKVVSYRRVAILFVRISGVRHKSSVNININRNQSFYRHCLTLEKRLIPKKFYEKKNETTNVRSCN